MQYTLHSMYLMTQLNGCNLRWMGVLSLLWISIGMGVAAPLTNCRIDGFERVVRCGQLQRPLNPDQPQGRQITLHFVVLPAKDKNKLPDPLFLLAGGPGQSAINTASWAKALFEKLGRRRDLVFVDQRGTGQSAPLDCPESSDVLDELDPARAVQQVRSCQKKLEKLPYGDLRYFTTFIAMQDLEAVRVALAYPEINVVGVSYGTRAALEYARQFPAAVRRMVLDGVVPPDHGTSDDDVQLALNAVLADCAVDVRCHQAYPHLQRDWTSLLASFPQKTRLTHPRLLTTIPTTITRDAFLGMVISVLYSPVSSAGLPYVLERAAQGEFTPLLALSGTGNLANPGRIFYGMHFSVWCSEEYDRSSVSTSTVMGNAFAGVRQRSYDKICPDWPRGRVPAEFYTIPKATKPVLLLSGGIDPVTPPWHAAHVAHALGAKARHLMLAHSGHGMLTQTCVADIVRRFINADTDPLAQNVDASCLKPIPRPSVWIAPQAASSQVSVGVAP